METEWRVEEDFLAGSNRRPRAPHPTFEDGVRYIARRAGRCRFSAAMNGTIKR